MEDDKKSYEISFLLNSADLAGEIDRALSVAGAGISERGLIKEIRLAYPIKKHTGAYFGFYHFQADPSVIQTLRQNLTLNEKVLRFLIVTPPIQRKQPMIQGRPFSSAPSASPQVQLPQVLTNEALEQKLEEILK